MPLKPHALVLIYHPLSGFLSIARYVGITTYSQLPTIPYQRDTLSPTHITSDGLKTFCDAFDRPNETVNQFLSISIHLVADWTAVTEL